MSRAASTCRTTSASDASLTLSPGVRYELQTHVNDRANVGPRFAVTWAPFKSGKTTLRGSTGIFYDWLDQFTYEQTLRVDGFRQRELDISNPAYPDPGTVGGVGVVPPVTRYLLAPDWQMPRNVRFTGAADQAITPQAPARRGLQLHAPREHRARAESECARSTASARIPPSATSSRRFRTRARASTPSVSTIRSARCRRPFCRPTPRGSTGSGRSSSASTPMASGATTSRASSARRRAARSPPSGGPTRTTPATA